MDIINKMNQFEQQKKYIPTKETYIDLKGKEGFFTDFKREKEQPESAKALEMMIIEVNDMSELIHENFLQPSDRKQEFADGNPVLKSLRQ